VFDSVDADHGGTVSKTELVNALHTGGGLYELMGLPPHVEDVRKSRAVQRYFSQADAGHNERLSWEEFVASVEAVHTEVESVQREIKVVKV
jgi:hypothetical protein